MAKSNETKSSDNKIFKKYKFLKNFPLVKQLVLRHSGEYGTIRVFRKSLREVEALRIAIPREYFNTEWISSGAQPEKGKPRYFGLWIQTNIQGLPKLAQTIVFMIKEED